MAFSPRIILEWMPRLIYGFRITLLAFGMGTVFSLAVGIIIGLTRFILEEASPVLVPFRWLLDFHIEFFRNVPLIVQLFFIFYGLPALGFSLSPFYSGLVGLTLCESAFIAEIMRGTLQGIPERDWEAAKAVAFSKSQIIRYVVLPQAWRDAIPSLLNQISITLKDTALLSLIMVPEMLYQADRLYSQTFSSSGYLFVGLVWILLYQMLDTISRQVEEKVRVRR